MKSYHAGRRKEEVSNGGIGCEMSQREDRACMSNLCNQSCKRHGFQEVSMIQAAEATPPKPYM